MKGPGLNNCGLQKVAGVRPQKVQGRRLQPIGRWPDASPDLEFQGQAQDPGRQVGKDEAGPSDRGWGTRRAGAQPQSQGWGLVPAGGGAGKGEPDAENRRPELRLWDAENRRSGFPDSRPVRAEHWRWGQGRVCNEAARPRVGDGLVHTGGPRVRIGREEGPRWDPVGRCPSWDPPSPLPTLPLCGGDRAGVGRGNRAGARRG